MVMEVADLVGLLSHFDQSWHALRRHLVYEDGARLAETAFRGQDRIAVMTSAVGCRRQIVDTMLDEVLDGLAAARSGEFVRDKSGTRCQVVGGVIAARWQVIAIGSANPTSDYDVSFNFDGDSGRETEAVETFNARFVARFGAPSADFFDTNAYTSGFMTSLDGIKLSTPRLGERFEGLRRHKAEIDELQLALSLAPLRHYCGPRWPDAVRALEDAGRTFVASFVGESRLPPGQPGDVLDLHLSKRSPTEHPVDEQLAARLDVLLGNLLKKVAIYLEQLETSVARLLDPSGISRLVPPGIRDDQRETYARDRLYEMSLRLCSERIDWRKALGDPDAYAAATTDIVAAVGISNIFANEAYYAEGPLYHVGPFGPRDIFTRKHILQGVLTNIGYKLLHTNPSGVALSERLGATPIPEDLLQTWYAASKYGGRILSLLRPFENMYGQYVGKDSAVYWACWRYLAAQPGVLTVLEIDEAIVAEIKKGPAGESADYAAIGAAMKNVVERRLPIVAAIEAHLLQVAGVTIGATCLSKAIELTTRADLAGDVEPWFESATTAPGSFFADVFSELAKASPSLGAGAV